VAVGVHDGLARFVDCEHRGDRGALLAMKMTRRAAFRHISSGRGLMIVGMLIVIGSLPCRAAPQQQETPKPAVQSAIASAAADPPASSAVDNSTESSDEQQFSSVGNVQPKDQDGSEAQDNSLGIPFLRNLMTDQETIWTSPLHMRWSDAGWLLPLGEVAAGFVETDEASARALQSSASTLNRYRNFSNYSLGAFAGAAGGLYVLGKFTHDDHKRETGVLVAEAMIDSLAANSALKYSFGRERPYQDQGQGLFFHGGTSFPSDHAALAWSAASVITHEYPGTLTDILAYGAATAISVSRVKGEEHFPSDVVVGSAIGWLIGHEVYRKHHDPDLGGGGWEDLSGGVEPERNRNRRSMGSPFVPLDSWVYPELDRLAALGYISTSIEGLKPWTRMECARLAEEAREALTDGGVDHSEAEEFVDRLQREFGYETNLLSGGRNRTVNLDSAYARTVSISGPDLNNSYNFGQTVSYDFGRPFERGTNLQDGGSVSAAEGPITVSVRAEYQQTPSAPALPVAARNFIGTADPGVVVPDTPIAGVNRPEVLDAYVAWDWNNFEVSVGRQSLSWGPGPGGSLIWSDNMVPVDMVLLTDPEPFRLPGIMKYLGPARIDQFFGRLGGHEVVREPFIYGQKIDFKPLPSLELGFSRTTILGGRGPDAAPLTPGNFFDSLFGIASFDHSVPGGSSSNMDWTFYVPHVHNYIEFYGELYTRDNFQPLQNPGRMAFRPGLYITHFPKLSKLDLHLEAASTESPGENGGNGFLNYYDSQYTEGWTNYGYLIGNTVGRMGQAYQAWLTYWISPRNTLQITYKNSRVDGAFVPGGGAWQDYGAENEFHLHCGFYVKSELQYENISHYPILFKGPQANVTAIIEAGFMPERNK
jgi:Capsule assembly protein Wzi/PAP2 superfamily